jgi:hypothetical protein
VLTHKHQPSAGLSHPRFHPLVGRIFSTALKSNFDPEGIGGFWHCGADGKETPLPQLPSDHIERKHRQVRGLPQKWASGTHWARRRVRGRKVRNKSPECSHASGEDKRPSIERHSVQLAITATRCQVKIAPQSIVPSGQSVGTFPLAKTRQLVGSRFGRGPRSAP